MVQTTFRGRRTRPMVKHATSLLKPRVSLYKILIKICLGLCLALKSRFKKGKKNRRRKLKQKRRSEAALKNNIIKSIKSGELNIVKNKMTALLMFYCRL